MRISVDDLDSYIGKEIGVSRWLDIAQERVNQFADVTEDHQFIHVDIEKAKDTPFGGTIAHGFLTLSLLAGLAEGCTLTMEGIKMGVNYGFEKVRFMAPVKVGKRVRARFILKEAKQRGRGIIQLIYDASIEIEDETKPALKAEWIVLQYI